MSGKQTTTRGDWTGDPELTPSSTVPVKREDLVRWGRELTDLLRYGSVSVSYLGGVMNVWGNVKMLANSIQSYLKGSE